MRILCLSDLWKPFPGGAESYIARVVDALVERGHHINILTSYAKAKSPYGMTIADIGVGERHMQGLGVISQAIFNYAPDLLLSHHFFCGEFFKEIAEYSLVMPFVEIVHNRPRHPNAAFAIFNSQYTAARCGCRDEDIVMIPPVGADVIAEGEPFTRLYIGHIKAIPNRLWGGQWFGKGVNLTYSLARIMPEKRFLVLRGEWKDAEYVENLPNVEFMEPVDDIREFYSKCRIVLMPSGSEDAGTVPQECALNGIPCISSDVGGLPETNAGLKLSPHEIKHWIESLEVLDDELIYRDIADHQKAYIESIDWEQKFDLISDRMEALCAKSA